MGLRLKILDRDKYKCRRCGFSGNHLIPVCFGGSDNENNLVTLCEKCHPYVENRTINKILKTAVKKKCISCKGIVEIKADIRDCTAYDCKLYYVRPYQKKEDKI